MATSDSMIQDTFAALPLWAQVLIAVRMARRGALAMAQGKRQAAMLAACEALEWCAEHGGHTHDVKARLDRAAALRDKAGEDERAAAQSVWYAIDAARAAEAAMDFPVDATVTRSALIAIQSLADDQRVSAMQLAILVAADIDQVRFACGEARVQTYNGVTAHVLGRLAPVHAITLGARVKSAEEEAR